MDLIGDMRQSVTLCLNAPTSLGAGGRDNYGALLTTRGKLSKSSANRALTFGEIQGESSYTLVVRYQQAIDVNISISAKWLIDNVFYTIESWEKIEQRNFYYKFRLNKKEPVASGSVSLDAITATGLQDPLYLTGVGGQTTINTGLPGNAQIILVAKSGLIYKPVGGVPGNSEYSNNAGVLTFNVAFISGEIVFILYKIVS